MLPLPDSPAAAIQSSGWLRQRCRQCDDNQVECGGLGGGLSSSEVRALERKSEGHGFDPHPTELIFLREENVQDVLPLRLHQQRRKTETDEAQGRSVSIIFFPVFNCFISVFSRSTTVPSAKAFSLPSQYIT